ncbi:hypothetical protein SVEN_5639 [Streptomyces venezuelae ATCC 10712]|uniref:Uncharacterized protein n=2 Tax=Streptomyces venezuelae TaxID=54571 RepID=F2R982_STRVP|nr:hypothetical protein SVEN_5639 [Streptomyces venezuelae ATCC 10712]
MAAGGSDRGRANVPRSTATPVRKALTSLDHRVELAVGYTVDRLWSDHDRGLLDEQIESVAAAHRSLSSAEQSVTFYRVLLQRLASGEYPMDSALFDRIDRTVKQLQEAVRIRGARETELSDVLEPVEADAARTPAGHTDLKAHDIALLLAIGQGAKLREHLLTQRLSVVTASGTRIGQHDFARLETAGLVHRDTNHPLHAGQPVALTDAGRAALAARPSSRVTSRPAPRPGAWPDAATRTR